MLQNGMLVSSVSEDKTLHQQQQQQLLHNCVNVVDVSMMPMFHGFCCDNSLVSGQVLDLQDHRPDNTLLGAHDYLPTLGHLSLATKVAVPGNTSTTTAAAASSCCQMSVEKEITMMDEKVCHDDVVFIDNNEPNSNEDSLSTKTEADDDKIVVVEEECEEKRTRVEPKLESKPKKRTRGGNSSPNLKENPKASPVHKPNYIHVRARRGQATDSHSLAERARREKISKKMQRLQDLVPGCSKIVGKAGVLDEIINYVQSLQIQVEFLSMKLATHNPRLDFNVENFTAQEETPACVASFPAAPMSSALANLAELQLNPGQQVTTNYELEGPIYAPQNAVEAATSSSVSILEPYTIDSSCFTQIQRLPTWDSDLLSLEYGVLDQE